MSIETIAVILVFTIWIIGLIWIHKATGKILPEIYRGEVFGTDLRLRKRVK